MALRTKEFFETATPGQFEWVLNLYDQALRLKAESKSSKPDNVIKLDKWYQNDLPKKIKSRGKDAHLTHEEMVQTIKWKLARGKFRPNLTNLVMMNTPRVCIQETKKAFRKLYKEDMTGAVQALCNLKGVGPAMASAVLAAGAPHLAPFMADECLWAMPDVDSLDYTMKEYMNLIEHVNACVGRLNRNGSTIWTPHKVELAMWTHYVVADLKPELLINLPSSKNSVTAVSSSESVDHQTTDGASTDSEDINFNPAAAKSSAEALSELSSSAALTLPPENTETAVSTSERVDHQTTDGTKSDLEDNNHNPAAAKSNTESSTDSSSSAALTLPPENTDTVVSTSDRVHHQTIDGGKAYSEDNNSNHAAAKSSTETSTDSSSAALTPPPKNIETSKPDKVIPSENGRSENDLSQYDNHNVADNIGTAPVPIAVECNDAKVKEHSEGVVEDKKEAESDLRNANPIMTNGQNDQLADTGESAPSPPQNHDVHISPANLTPQTANGNNSSMANANETSTNNRPLPEVPPVNPVPQNVNSENGTAKVPQNQQISAAVTSNYVGEDWVFVEKEDCPTTESVDHLPQAPLKRLLDTSEKSNDTTITPVAGDDPPLQKKARTEESTSDQDTIEAIKKQQHEQMAETASTPAMDNGSSRVGITWT